MSNSQKKKAAAIAHNLAFDVKKAEALDRKNNPEKYEEIARQRRIQRRKGRRTDNRSLGMAVATMAAMGIL